MENIQPFRKPSFLLSFILLSSFCFSQVTEQWVRTYYSGFLADRATLLQADASGNVYVTESSCNSIGFIDFATKYDTDHNEH